MNCPYKLTEAKGDVGGTGILPVHCTRQGCLTN